MMICVRLLNIGSIDLGRGGSHSKTKSDVAQTSDNENVSERGLRSNCCEGQPSSGLLDDGGEDRDTQNHRLKNFTRWFEEMEDLCKVYAPCINHQTTQPESCTHVRHAGNGQKWPRIFGFDNYRKWKLMFCIQSRNHGPKCILVWEIQIMTRALRIHWQQIMVGVFTRTDKPEPD